MEMGEIKTLIIDDDPFIRDLLLDKLIQYFPEINNVDTAGSGKEGIEKINFYKPDLIFLDVEMSDGTGFEMLSQIEKITFKTIFITSYSHYAIKAIRFNALDYLVKPIDLGELKQAINRYKKNVQSSRENDNLKLALYNFKTKDVANHKLTIQTQEGELRLILKDITHIEGDGNYSYIHLKNNTKKLVSKTLSNLEEMLDSKGFFRCHKSYIINKEYIAGTPKSFALMLLNGKEIPISRRRQKDFKAWFESL